MQIKVNQFFQVRADDLICVNEDDFLQVHREQYIKEQDLVCPNDPLFLFLSAQPRGPFVSHELILKAILLREVWNKFLTTGQVPVPETAVETKYPPGMMGIRSFR